MKNKLNLGWSLMAIGILASGCIGYNPEGNRGYAYVDWENGRALIGTVTNDFDQSEKSAQSLAAIGESKYGGGCHKGGLHDQHGEGFDGMVCVWGRRK